MDRTHRTHPDTSSRNSGRRTLGRLGVVAVAVVAGGTLAASTASATGAGVWHTADLFHMDGVHDTWMIDTDGDAPWEYFYVDTDPYPDGYVDVGVFDLYGDGSILFYDLAPLDGTFETLIGADGRPTGQAGPTIDIGSGPVPLSPPGMPNSGCLPFALPDGWECRPA